jgi:hypothetical protein
MRQHRYPARLSAWRSSTRTCRTALEGLHKTLVEYYIEAEKSGISTLT